MLWLPTCLFVLSLIYGAVFDGCFFYHSDLYVVINVQCTKLETCLQAVKRYMHFNRFTLTQRYQMDLLGANIFVFNM